MDAPAAPPRTRTLTIDGPAGPLQVFDDGPLEAPSAIVVIGHPHPVLGGNAEHKVPQIMARTFAMLGMRVLRPNFRGVGASAGEHDEGNGEVDDLLAAVALLRDAHPGAPLLLAGFSFGAFVQVEVARRLAERSAPCNRLVLAGMPNGEVPRHRHYAPGPVPADTLVIHGELDDRVPLGNVLDWARPQELPVTVIPGADHFFARKLHVLRAVMLRALGPAR